MQSLTVLSKAGLPGSDSKLAKTGSKNTANGQQPMDGSFLSLVFGMLNMIVDSKGQHAEDSSNKAKLTTREMAIDSSFPVGMEANSGTARQHGFDPSDGNKPALMESAAGEQKGSGMISPGLIGENVPLTTELDFYREIGSFLLKELSGTITATQPGTGRLGQTDSRQSEVKGVSAGQSPEVAEVTEVATPVVDSTLLDVNKFQAVAKLQNLTSTIQPGASGLTQTEQKQAAIKSTPTGKSTEFANEVTTVVKSAFTDDSKLNVISKSQNISSDVHIGKANLTPAPQRHSAITAQVFPDNPERLQKSEARSLSTPENEWLVNKPQIEVPTSVGDNIQTLDQRTINVQLIDHLRDYLSNGKNQAHEFDIQLHPAELGKIQISVRWEAGQVHLQLQASEPSTSTTLLHNIPSLRQDLENIGVSCGSLQMGTGGQEHRGQQSMEQPGSRPTLSQSEEVIAVTNQPLVGFDDPSQHINITV